MEEEKSNINTLVDHAKEYVETTVDLMKTEAVDRISTAASSFASSIILGVTGVFFLLFASVGCAWVIAHSTGSKAIGFFSVAAFYLLLSIIIYVSREKWIKVPIVNAILKLLTDDK